MYTDKYEVGHVLAHQSWANKAAIRHKREERRLSLLRRRLSEEFFFLPLNQRAAYTYPSQSQLENVCNQMGKQVVARIKLDGDGNPYIWNSNPAISMAPRI